MPVSLFVSLRALLRVGNIGMTTHSVGNDFNSGMSSVGLAHRLREFMAEPSANFGHIDPFTAVPTDCLSLLVRQQLMTSRSHTFRGSRHPAS